jgi:tetratricopeptide (TPR) repeat protein
MRGDFEQSLQEIEQALALLSPGQHQAWPHAARCQLECLLALGRFAEARQLGAKYLEAARQAGLQIMASHIAMPLALAEAALGETAAAVARMDSELRAREAYGHTGLTMGLLYEYRARLAVILQDPAAFSDYAARCAAQFQGGAHNPALMAKLERLNELANRWSLTPSNAQSDAVELGGASAAAHNSQTETVRLMLTQHETFEARAKQSIQMILDQTGASEAYLFLARAGEIRFAASSSGASPPDLMQDAAAQFVQSELEKEVVTVAGDAPCKGPTVIITKNSSFRPLLLACVDSGDLLVAGVALVRVEPPRAAPQQFFGALARYLIDLGDASPLQAQA